MKQATAQTTPESVGEIEAAEEVGKPKNPYKGPLKGGIGQSTGGKFGLKW